MRRQRSPAGGLTAFSLAILFLFPLNHAILRAEEYSEEFSRVVPFTSGGKLTIETQGGSVVFSGGEGTDVVIEATKTVDADNPEDAKKRLSGMAIDVRRSGDKLRIETVYPHEKRGFLGKIFGGISREYGTVDYSIVLPRRADVRLDATSTFVKGTDLEGRVSIDLSSGDVSLEQIDGIVYVDGTSGTITVKGIGADLSVDNTSGDVEAAEVAGNVEIDKTSGAVTLGAVGGSFFLDGTSCEVRAAEVAGSAEIDVTSGDVRIEGLGGGITFEGTSGDLTVAFDEGPGGPCEINTSSGDVELITNEQPKFDLSLETSSGKMSARLPDMEILEVSDEGLEAVVGGGGVTVHVETTSGNITVRRK